MTLENIAERVTLQGESMIDDERVASFSCTIDEDGYAGNLSVIVRNRELYKENRAEVRKDQSEFQAEVWEVEDRLSE